MNVDIERTYLKNGQNFRFTGRPSLMVKFSGYNRALVDKIKQGLKYKENHRRWNPVEAAWEFDWLNGAIIDNLIPILSEAIREKTRHLIGNVETQQERIQREREKRRRKELSEKRLREKQVKDKHARMLSWKISSDGAKTKICQSKWQDVEELWNGVLKEGFIEGCLSPFPTRRQVWGSYRYENVKWNFDMRKKFIATKQTGKCFLEVYMSFKKWSPAKRDMVMVDKSKMELKEFRGINKKSLLILTDVSYDPTNHNVITYEPVGLSIRLKNKKNKVLMTRKFNFRKMSATEIIKKFKRKLKFFNSLIQKYNEMDKKLKGVSLIGFLLGNITGNIQPVRVIDARGDRTRTQMWKTQKLVKRIKKQNPGELHLSIQMIDLKVVAGTCFCGHPIRYDYIVTVFNDRNQRKWHGHIGSVCIGYFQELSGAQIRNNWAVET